jgi:hypothetical protein
MGSSTFATRNPRPRLFMADFTTVRVPLKNHSLCRSDAGRDVHSPPLQVIHGAGHGAESAGYIEEGGPQGEMGWTVGLLIIQNLVADQVHRMTG